MKALLIMLAAGALGGNLLPLLHRRLRRLGLRASGNSLAGLTGGGLGASLADALGLIPADDPARVVVTAVAALIGGMLITAILGVTRNSLAK